MDKNILFEKVKEARLNRFLTNCYSMDILDKVNELWEDDSSFLFSCSDHGIERLYYFARDYETLNALLSQIPKGKYYLEFMTNRPDEYVPIDSVLVARMKRMSNSDCRDVFENSPVLQYRNDSIVEYAKADDTQEINKILWETFHTEVSHLLYDEELESQINEQNVMVHKNPETGAIDALLQTDVMPKKFYVNQVINRGEKHVIHAIMLKRLHDYIENGGKYAYAWVQEDNAASIKFHEKYGMSHDGMWDIIYCLEK